MVKQWKPGMPKQGGHITQEMADAELARMAALAYQSVTRMVFFETHSLAVWNAIMKLEDQEGQ